MIKQNSILRKLFIHYSFYFMTYCTTGQPAERLLALPGPFTSIMPFCIVCHSDQSVSSNLKLRDVISKNGQISPRLLQTQFLFAIKIKSTSRIVPPNTWILDLSVKRGSQCPIQVLRSFSPNNFWTFYQFSVVEVHFSILARYDPF